MTCILLWQCDHDACRLRGRSSSLTIPGCVSASGHPGAYTGEAVNPANLSWVEGMLGVGRAHSAHSAELGPQNGKAMGPASQGAAEEGECRRM